MFYNYGGDVLSEPCTKDPVMTADLVWAVPGAVNKPNAFPGQMEYKVLKPDFSFVRFIFLCMLVHIDISGFINCRQFDGLLVTGEGAVCEKPKIAGDRG